MFKKCVKCGALVEALKDCNCNDCGLMCCGEKMIDVKANSSDGAVEKHKPEYKVIGENVEIVVNHVMEEEHYIEWIRVQTDAEIKIFKFKPGELPQVVVPYQKGMKIYSLCNKHGLWETVVE